MPGEPAASRRSSAPGSLLPRCGAGEDNCHLCKGDSPDGGLLPGTRQARARAEPRDRHR